MEPIVYLRNAAGGVRVSTEKQQQEGDSPEDQKEQITLYAQRHNYRIVTWFEYSESATKVVQPMQDAITYCADPANGIDSFIIKSIDRFTRGGSSTYSILKDQLERANVSLVDLYGVISSERVNTLAHTGFAYDWSKYSPSHKAEILEAERGKDEFRDIMTRVIGAEIRYTQLGYWQRQPQYGYVSERIDTKNGKRMVLRPHPTEAQYVRRIAELRTKGILTDTQIVEQINREGCKRRFRNRRIKMDGRSVVVQQGGTGMTIATMQKIIANPIYAGIICEKWTNYKPIKAVFEGLLSIDEFNAANRGRKAIIEDADGAIEILTTQTARSQAIIPKRDEFAFRHYILCPQCKHPFLASSSRGKMGKLYPAYHCSKQGHYLRIPKAQVEATIAQFIQSLEFDQETVDKVMSIIEGKWDQEAASAAGAAQRIDTQIEALRLEAKQTVGKLKLLNSETAMKYMEEDLMRIEQEIKQLTMKQVEVVTEMPVQKEPVLQKIRSMVEHPYELYQQQISTARKAQFFGLFFTERPTLADLQGRTQKIPLFTGVHLVYKLLEDIKYPMVISRRIELRLPG
jgi:hypothetical protein